MTISPEEYAIRSERLREKMKGEGLDALIVFSDEYRSGNGTYLTGYKPINVIEESPQVVIYVGENPPVTLLGRLNLYAAKDVIWSKDVRPFHRAAEFIPEILAPLKDRAAQIGLIGDNLLPMNLFALFRDALPKATFTSVDRLLIALRQVKSPTEIALMERAANINDEVLKAVSRRIYVGMTEMQVAGLCEGMARDLNADIGSATVVMSGPNTNYAAWRPSERKIERGDFVMIDFNPSVQNYCNDGGITVLMPGATKEQVEAGAGDENRSDLLRRDVHCHQLHRAHYAACGNRTQRGLRRFETEHGRTDQRSMAIPRGATPCGAANDPVPSARHGAGKVAIGLSTGTGNGQRASRPGLRVRRIGVGRVQPATP